MLKQFICRIAGHAINRKRVWHDGLEFRTKCSRCGKPMIRADKGWRVFDGRRDDDARRQSHEHSAC